MKESAVEWMTRHLRAQNSPYTKEQIIEIALEIEKEQKRYSEVEVIEAIRLARETELKTGGFDSRPFTGNKYLEEEIINQLKSE